jgi:hypothetical protein
VGQPTQQCALAGIRTPNQPNVGDHLQFQDEASRLSILAGREFAWGTIRGTLEVRVALATATSARCRDAVALAGEILDHKTLLGVDHDRPRGHFDDEIAAIAAVPIASLTMCSTRRFPHLAMSHTGQVIDACASFHDHAATVSAVTAVRTSAWYESLTPKATASVSAVSGMHIDLNSVDKHRFARSSGK